MRSLLVSAALLAAAATLAQASDPPTRFDPAGSDPRAIQLVDSVQQALGMPGAWRDAHCIEFTFGQARGDSMLAPGRRHCWDTWTNRYRVEGFAKSLGKSYVVIFGNVNDPHTARVWLDGQLQTADSTVSKFAQAGYGAYINDTYWLLMPYKMKDPGVHLRWMGAQRDSASGADYEAVGLSFDKVGLTPLDHYTVWIDPATHRVAKWQYFDGQHPGNTMIAGWEDYREAGSLWISQRRPILGHPVAVVLRDVAVSSSVPEAKFQGP
ncbi:MAG TPA: hypothetical protein VMS93_04985 [Candidatus Saccharimonadales bacterium]|nr:hypothetical protein [Candidatus Saccharimonadales bacterium]